MKYKDKNGNVIIVGQDYYDEEADVRVIIEEIDGQLCANPIYNDLDPEPLKNVCGSLVRDVIGE